jgi:hypothetical protein
VVCFIDNLNEQLQNHNGMNGVNYDNWLNRHNPYDKDYEREEERAYHLDKIKDMDEEEINDYLFFNRIEDPREEE